MTEISIYDYPFSTPTKAGGKITAKNLKSRIAAVFVVYQRDSHIL